jgi:hypothetical protein
MCRAIINGDRRWIPLIWDFFNMTNFMGFFDGRKVFFDYKEIVIDAICCNPPNPVCNCSVLHFIVKYWFDENSPRYHEGDLSFLPGLVDLLPQESPMHKYSMLINRKDGTFLDHVKKCSIELAILPEIFAVWYEDIDDLREIVPSMMPVFGPNLSYMGFMKNTESTSKMKVYWDEMALRTVDFFYNISFPLPIGIMERVDMDEFGMFQDLIGTELKDPFLLWEFHKRGQAVLSLLLVARKYDPTCPFHVLPLDMFKIIVKLSDLK